MKILKELYQINLYILFWKLNPQFIIRDYK